MFLSTVNRSRRVGRGVRAASYFVAALVGAAGVTLLRRTAGSLPRRLPTHRAPRVPLSQNLRDAGWAELIDDRGDVLARGKVMLALSGVGDARTTPVGEVRSLRLAPGAFGLVPGPYRLRFETGMSAHDIEVTAFPADGTDVAAIRWNDHDLPPSLAELGGN